MNSIDRRFVLGPAYHCVDKLSLEYAKPCITTNAESGPVKRTVAPIANVGKKSVIVLAGVIGALVTGIYSLLSFPCRAYQRHKIEQMGIQHGLNLLTPAEKESFRQELEKYLKDNDVAISPKEKQAWLNKIMASYGRSKKIYGPVARAWTDMLLEKAQKEGKKIVFLARDGAVPFKIAKALMKTEDYRAKYPNLTGDKQIVLAYFSRKVVKSSLENEKTKAIFNKYITNELGLKDGDKCIFVDVGFLGSMIDDFRKNLLPTVSIDFEYLISHTPKAHGFVGINDKNVKSVGTAGGNPGIHWLEDTHQGYTSSPSKLVEVGDHVYPNTKQPGKPDYCVPKNSLEFLVRKFTQRGVVESSQEAPIPEAQVEAVKQKFADTIGQIKDKKLPLFVEHR